MKVFIRAFKKFLEFRKKEREIWKAEYQLVNMPIHIAALQKIADTVSSGYEVKITVEQPDGHKIIFERSKPATEKTFVTFQDKFNEYHK